MRSLTFYPVSITHSADEFVISQLVGETADDVVTIKITEDQAQQIAKFLVGKNKHADQVESGSPELAVGWQEFWEAYPRKDGKARAFELWKRHGIYAQRATVMTHLAAAKLTEQWTRDGGKFVPHASTYLGQKRYLDDIETEDVSAWT